ncbi:GIY-YIG nuclease family protein [Gloeocapsopsis dulcis]|uniref:GIY-YIG nuclease family protein n=1 Tax=Gloeocapsopsis dulcis TaxID=2859516 RepID=UPI000CF63713|nr:GIY-YIG nuclease family protein [Gloeocapsopsis dulcis]WNN89206.1 GIY-YIG nuclease family protein [Gloeocapsopsis dulcis]
MTDSKGQILYIGRTVNLFKRWREHHRFKQLKRFNRKDCVSISWITCSNDLSILSSLENEFIQRYKPPLNWTKVLVPVRKITPVETVLQQSLQQLVKLNTTMLGFNPISGKDPPTLYLAYPVYGRCGVSGSIRSILRTSNKKASALKWKEYHTEPKSFGKFGYWQTEYNGIQIDLSPFPSLVDFIDNATHKTVAGIKFMAFSHSQLEKLLEDVPALKKGIPSLEALEGDPIPIQPVDHSQLNKRKNKDVVKVELWEELEPMAEGEAREMSRQFLNVDGVEVEVCTNGNGKDFVRHNVYWWIVHREKNPDPERYNIIKHSQSDVNILPTIRWSGYRFRFETIVFSEDDVEVESILLPLAMFEDLMRDKSRFSGQLYSDIESGEYKSKQYNSAYINLCGWLQQNTLFSLLQSSNK